MSPIVCQHLPNGFERDRWRHSGVSGQAVGPLLHERTAALAAFAAILAALKVADALGWL